MAARGDRNGAIAYRREIDGLRAIAVLAVMLFHARIRGFAGGFVGVDIFLVISGYLITQLILREDEGSGFSLASFYERRVRRILPALLAMLAASAIAGWILLPADFRDFGASLAAVALLGSNLLFWGQDGYFRLTAEATPLLHTWSLAVEEQFYLVFPILLLIARRRPWALRVLIVTTGLASFAYSAWSAQADPAAAFYSPLSRAWEFLAGALLATGMLPAPRQRALGDAAALAGLFAIGQALWTLSERSAFPGTHALAPVLGAVAILWGSQAPASRIARLLGARPLVAIGLISYSLYLWHWPLIVFGTYWTIEPRPLLRPALALLAFPLAWLSWRYIERPFRKPRLMLSRQAIFLAAFTSSLATMIYGASIYLAQGLPGRFDPVVQRLNTRGPEPDYGCAGKPLAAVRNAADCRIGAAAVRPSFAVWGDSHAAVYLPALSALARRNGVAGYDLTALGCPPLLPIRAQEQQPDQWMFRSGAKQACAAHNAATMRFLEEARPRLLLLGARWSVYRGIGPRPAEEAAQDARVFASGILRLRALGIAVAVVLDVPEAPFAEPRRLAKARRLGALSSVEPRRADHLRKTAAFRALAEDLRRRGLITVIDPSERLCGPRTCRVVQDGHPLYFDGNHLSSHGAALIAPAFLPALRQSGGQ